MREAEDEEAVDRLGALDDSDEIPDWLRDLEPVDLEARTAVDVHRAVVEDTAVQAEPATNETAAARPDRTDLQDVLRATRPSVPGPAEDLAALRETAVPPVRESIEIPDWLLDMMSSEVTGAGGGVPVPEEPAEQTASALVKPATSSDGLQEPRPPEESQAQTLGMPAPTEVSEELERLTLQEETAGEASPGEAERMPGVTAPTMPELAEIPGWLREAMPPEVTAGEGDSSVAEGVSGFPASPVPDLAEIPDWLKDIALQEATGSSTAGDAQLATAFELPRESQPEMPLSRTARIPGGAEVDADEQWLAALQAELEAAATPALPEMLPGPLEAEELARAQIPDWLQVLRPAAEAGDLAVEEEALETEGVLEGLRGVLPLMPALGAAAPSGQVRPAGSTPASLARAQLLQSLITQPRPVARRELPRSRARVGERIERWIVAIVLVGAVLGTIVAPLFLPDVSTLVDLPGVIPAADALYAVVESLSPGDAVMLAFEYGPEQADELDLVAGPIVRHVLDRGGRVSVVSTRPDGLAVAARLFRAVTPDSEADQHEMTYIPGGVAGVAQVVNSRPDLVIVLAGKPGPLRWWVEQTRAIANPPAIVAGTSAALEPAASPYLDPSAGQLMGAVSGLSGAAYYDKKASGTTDGWDVEHLNTLAVGHAAIIFLIVLGAILHATGILPGKAN
jgi:hypothetical protein